MKRIAVAAVFTAVVAGCGTSPTTQVTSTVTAPAVTVTAPAGPPSPVTTTVTVTVTPTATVPSTPTPTTPSVSRYSVASEITSKLRDAGVTVSSTTCDADLPAVVGATITCVAYTDNGEQRLRPRVNSVVGKTVNYTVEKA